MAKREGKTSSPPQKASCTYHPVKANSLSHVNFERNRYSVPVRYTHHNLILKAFVDSVDIFYKEKLVVSHRLLLAKGEESLNVFHYLRLLLKKPGAFSNARPIRNWSAPPIYREALGTLRKRYPGGRGKREFLKTLELQRNGKKDKLEKAIKMASELNCLSFDSVKNILDSLESHSIQAKTLDLFSHPALLKYRVDKKDIGAYNLLRERFQ